jgi:hypothetical protein
MLPRVPHPPERPCSVNAAAGVPHPHPRCSTPAGVPRHCSRLASPAAAARSPADGEISGGQRVSPAAARPGLVPVLPPPKWERLLC